MMRFALICFGLMFWVNVFAAQNSRTDTFHVVHYDINLDISNVASHTIAGYTTVKVRSKIANLTSVNLDLQQLTVDSVHVNNTTVAYNYTTPLLTVQLASALNAGDSADIQVYYHGSPVADASWGGFYFSGNYAYNMGVGFSADPHPFGRVWFPCVDNFVDKSLYDFYITTSSTNRAMCNGLLQGGQVNNNGTITWHWIESRPIVTYLASVAVCNYAPAVSQYIGIRDTFPIYLAAPAIDTQKMVNSFVHLNAALAGYERAYGPQPFEKVGFTQVPFSGGAMEHAGNIAYPQFAVDGTTNQEDLWAHELSHHWWGDMVTCETPEDMWLNEGWASFTALYFSDIVYGHEVYKKQVRANHINVLQFAHINDGGYRAVSGVPHDYTYGNTVYKKGADVAHSLRGYLGDSTFFRSLKSHLQAQAYSTSNSYQFRDNLTAASGMDMTPFFNNWVFNPGFPHFSIDSFTAVLGDDSYFATVYIRQKLKAAPNYYSHVPLEVYFYDSTRQHKSIRTVDMGGRCGSASFDLPFRPAYVALDMEEKISDAITDKYLLIDSNGNYDFEEALMTMNVTSVTDTALVRVEHNWVYPDPIKTPISGLHLSQERYWKVDGIIPIGFHADATIKYNGTNSASSGYLDNKLFSINREDSLVVMYRASVKDDWSIDTGVTLVPQGSLTSKTGEFIIHDIQKGEYALAMWNHAIADSNVVLDDANCSVLGVTEVGRPQNGSFKIMPNPASDTFQIELAKPAIAGSIITITDITGKQVFSQPVTKGNLHVKLALRLNKGMYLVTISNGNNSSTEKLIIQ